MVNHVNVYKCKSSYSFLDSHGYELCRGMYLKSKTFI